MLESLSVWKGFRLRIGWLDEPDLVIIFFLLKFSPLIDLLLITFLSLLFSTYISRIPPKNFHIYLNYRSMDFLKLLNVLYGKDLASILSVLNSSVYVKKHITDGFVMHTGFSFSMHTEEQMDILYCLATGTIIRTPKTYSQTPQILGILLKKENGEYFNAISRFYFPVISEEPVVRYVIKGLESYLSKKPNDITIITEDTQEELLIQSLKVVNNNQTYEFPLNIHLKSIVFYGHGSFRRYDPEPYQREYQNNYDYYSENDAFYDATDGQLGDLGDFGWTHLGRD